MHGVSQFGMSTLLVSSLVEDLTLITFMLRWCLYAADHRFKELSFWSSSWIVGLALLVRSAWAESCIQ